MTFVLQAHIQLTARIADVLVAAVIAGDSFVEWGGGEWTTSRPAFAHGGLFSWDETDADAGSGRGLGIGRLVFMRSMHVVDGGKAFCWMRSRYCGSSVSRCGHS